MHGQARPRKYKSVKRAEQGWTKKSAGECQSDGRPHLSSKFQKVHLSVNRSVDFGLVSCDS